MLEVKRKRVIAKVPEEILRRRGIERDDAIDDLFPGQSRILDLGALLAPGKQPTGRCHPWTP